jgi:tetratricopeptide (TPR) repeat protein
VAVDRDKVLQAAQKLVEKKRYDKAIIEYQKLVAEDPKDARTLLKIGDLYLKLEGYAEAIGTYERVGQFYSLQGFALKAIAVYKQIREIVQKHVPHLEDRFGHIVPRLAELYTQLGLTSDALAAYDEVATRLQRAGRERDAIDIFRKVVELDPTNPLPHLRLAEAFARVRDIDGAVERFGAASEILIRLGRHDDAIKVLERLLQHRPDARFARTAAEVYLERGNPNDGMSALTKLQLSFKENPKDLETLSALARTFDRLSQPHKALEVLKEAGRVAIEVGRLDALGGILETIRRRAPGDPVIDQLVALAAAAATSMPQAAEPSTSEVLDEIEEIEADAMDHEAPFALRPSGAPVDAARGPAESASDPAARARAALAQADALRRARSHEQAVYGLRQFLQELPGVREIRDRLCDLLIEAGNQEGAIGEMLAGAHHLSSIGDVEGAARVLDEILLLEPAQPHAVEMLAALGYAVPGAAPPLPSGGYAIDYGARAAGGYDPDAPLPSYDLEEIGAAQAMSMRAPASVGQLDDPFAQDVPLPSYPMEEAPTRLGVPLTPPPVVHEALAQEPIEAPTPSPRGSGEQLDEDALDEVEFFASHGMFEEARGILDEQLTRLPGHPLLLEKRAEIEAMEHGADPHSGDRASRVEPSDRAFDIAASLDALDSIDVPAPMEAAAEYDPEVSVESVFQQFKAGVAAQVAQSDASTHYDLGVAYREMGLLDDAIHEFELAAREAERECICQSMIGMLHLEQGHVDAAIDAFIRGLHASYCTTEQELALTYEIGHAYELRNNAEQALYYFQRAARIDPSYRDARGDVETRIARLEPAPKPAPARAVGAGLVLDDFDSAFDDLLDSSKLP